MAKTVTVREVFDDDGKLVERVTTTTEDETPQVAPALPYPTIPYTPQPGTWYPQIYYNNCGGCSACAESGICNCVLGGIKITCSA